MFAPESSNYGLHFYIDRNEDLTCADQNYFDQKGECRMLIVQVVHFV